MTLSDLHGHAPNAGLLQCDFCTAVQQLTRFQAAQRARRAVPLRATCSPQSYLGLLFFFAVRRRRCVMSYSHRRRRCDEMIKSRRVGSVNWT